MNNSQFGTGLGPMRTALVRPQGFKAEEHWFYEFPYNDPQLLEIWCYTDNMSYAPGDEVTFYVHTTGSTYDLDIVKDGLHPRTVHCAEALPGRRQETPDDCSVRGCDWQATYAVRIPADWPSGCYLVVVSTTNDRGETRRSEHYFVVRAGASATSTAPMALVLTTSTMNAYNDWGGANSYGGLGQDPAQRIHSPVLSLHRPIARGQLVKPLGAPGPVNSFPHSPTADVRFESYEWAFANGYGYWHASAGWATYERPFVVWAEAQNYEFDYLTQHDLHYRPELLDRYRSLVVVGHDEYWSWQMRDHIDDFVEGGGNLARFAGNFYWQIRLENNGATQVCYKTSAADDPVLGSDQEHLLTSNWDDPRINRPAAATMGLSGSKGIYHRYAGRVPRGAGGFTVYRPDHWAFEGADLYYGDLLGASSGVVGFEVDGVDYVIADGLPHATQADGAPQSLEILALAPAVIDEDATASIGAMFAGRPPGHLQHPHGSGMIATFHRGDGTVFNAGSAEWVRGLTNGDTQIKDVTRTVLDRFASPSAPATRTAGKL
ncbi:conserved hypothetical protein [Kribbella flavida DSM 17836]|uniref:N,N-dimethylformamidase beta subunit-like C-terminal domain-containing protein n=1 Tax=Kribbella flavida (strain DSM 17836 / JCM 10339 / NBRC 14399) TaxID=479435 RepID=D2PWT7_KRIFD|nr:N,N-dimethylformamidase beta subunit family domain-containing protein [Kribbella flavida]ADB33556.1 conserved hypothetical protein [Kribbella flavida DSM 17836]